MCVGVFVLKLSGGWSGGGGVLGRASGPHLYSLCVTLVRAQLLISTFSLLNCSGEILHEFQ